MKEHSWVLTSNGDQVCTVADCNAVLNGETGEVDGKEKCED